MADYLGYVKLAVRGVAGGQNIDNILYYGNDLGEMFTFNDAFLASFLAEWDDAFSADWVSHQPDTYTLSELTAWAINERGVVISDNPASLAVGVAGGDAGACSTPAVTAILSIKTSRVSEFPARALKRSYLAIGPVPEVHVDTSGALTIAALAEYNALAALVATILTVGITDHQPIRVGRTEAPALPAVGTIVSVICQPYASFRKSRKVRPNGT